MDSNRNGTLRSVGLLILRIGAAGLLLYGHGWTKLIHFSERAAKFPNPIGVGPTASLILVVFAEVFCTLLIMLGLGTRLAAIPIVIFLLVAAFIQGAGDPFADRELALIYLIPFLTILFTGGGRYALDAMIGRNKRPS